MTPFQWRIPRDLARALGQEAVDIIDTDVPGAYRKIVFAIVDSWADPRTIGPFREEFATG